MDDGDRVHVKAVELVVTESATVPAKPSRGAMVIVDAPRAPTLAFTDDGVAD